MCFVCCQQPRNAVFESCKHCIVCYECSKKLKNKCPYCKKTSKHVIQVAHPPPGYVQTSSEEQATDNS